MVAAWKILTSATPRSTSTSRPSTGPAGGRRHGSATYFAFLTGYRHIRPRVIALPGDDGASRLEDPADERLQRLAQPQPPQHQPVLVASCIWVDSKVRVSPGQPADMLPAPLQVVSRLAGLDVPTDHYQECLWDPGNTEGGRQVNGRPLVEPTMTAR
jgi:hypothetical protein